MIVYCLILVCGIALMVMIRPKPSDLGPPSERTIGVVIAARNEADHIPDLLSDLSEQGFEQVVVVDDHSEDDTADRVRAQGVTCITLAKATGKKAAIQAGVNALETDYVLQLDADVRVDTGYHGALTCALQREPDLLILPIRYAEGGRFIEELQRHEQSALAAFNLGLPAPFQAYGGNLLYRRSAYQELVDERTDWNTHSGDDHFLLNAMTAHGKTVERVFHADLLADVFPVRGAFLLRGTAIALGR